MSEPTNQDIRDACAACFPAMDGVAYGFAGMCLILLKRYDALQRDLAAAQARIERYEALLNRCSDACKVVPVLVRNGEHISLPRQIELALMKGETLASVTECRHIFDDDRCVKCGGAA